jgi:hypothetical protein
MPFNDTEYPKIAMPARLPQALAGQSAANETVLQPDMAVWGTLAGVPGGVNITRNCMSAVGVLEK